MIDLTINKKQRENAIKQARERNIIIPHLAQMKNPELTPPKIKNSLKYRVMGYCASKSLPYHVEKRAGAVWRWV
jgi:hypothetical protein